MKFLKKYDFTILKVVGAIAIVGLFAPFVFLRGKCKKWFGSVAAKPKP